MRRLGAAVRWPGICAGVLLAGACASDVTQPPPFIAEPAGSTEQVGAVADMEAAAEATGPKLDEVSFAFEPYTGGPRNITDRLSKMVADVAENEGLVLKRQRGAVTTYQLLGHLTAVGDDAGTAVLYRYDILDASGRHLHRIHGQEISTSARGDPWSGVSDETLNNIALRTVNSVKTWVLSRSG